MDGIARIDGRRVSLDEANVAVTDDGFARGDGAFETMGVWDGRAFRVDDHLDRLTASLRAVDLPAPDRAAILGDIEALCDEAGAIDGGLRVYVTASGTRVATWMPPPPPRPTSHLATVSAPWIRPVGTHHPAGAKTMSYGPNMSATRRAQALGAEDAFLVSLEGVALEGPTFAVMWVVDGVLRAADRSLGVVDSLSRRTVLEEAEAAGIPVDLGIHPASDLQAATEVMACSSIRPLQPVVRIDDTTWDGPFPVCERLGERLMARRRDG